MEVVYSSKAITDISLWKASGNKKIQERISSLIQSIQETPFEGIGKPEALKHNFSGMWSRRINHTHRLIYQIQNEKVYVHSLRDHY